MKKVLARVSPYTFMIISYTKKSIVFGRGPQNILLGSLPKEGVERTTRGGTLNNAKVFENVIKHGLSMLTYQVSTKKVAIVIYFV